LKRYEKVLDENGHRSDVNIIYHIMLGSVLIESRLSYQQKEFFLKQILSAEETEKALDLDLILMEQYITEFKRFYPENFESFLFRKVGRTIFTAWSIVYGEVHGAI